MSEPMTTPSTSLRIRWAKALGWRAYQCGEHSHFPGKWRLDPPQQNAIVAERFDSEEEAFELYGPPIDANTVRMALMGMSETETLEFNERLYVRLTNDGKLFYYSQNPDILGEALKTPPETLAEIYCDVKNIKE
jgi:hypothetical protein